MSLTTPLFDTTDDDRRELESAIAEALAELSQAIVTPTGVSPSASFEAGEIEWQSSDWMSRLVSLQGRLRFVDPLDMDSPEGFIKGLARELGIHSGGIDQGSEGPRLTLDGLSRLRERAARAVDLQRRFQEDLDDESLTGAGAAQRWADGWEDAQDDPDMSAAEPVTASTDVWPISDFASRAKSKKLNLSPSYQRGDVWPTPDAQILMESILRGIPLPSVIILKPQNSATGVFEVVDGKQRLTAILRFIGHHPRAIEVVDSADRNHPGYDLKNRFSSDYRSFRTAWKNATGQPLTDKVERENYFPFKLRTGTDTALTGLLEKFRGKYYYEIRDDELAISDTTVAVSEIFETTTNYKIPVIQYTKATPRQIHEVFKLYNKQGKQLNAEEIRNAMYHELSLMRGLLVGAGDTQNIKEVAPFLFDKTVGSADEETLQRVADIARVLSSYGFGTTRYKRSKVLGWLCALLLLDSRQPDGPPSRRPTATQIDALLRAVEADPKHPLRDEERLRKLFDLIGDTLNTHSSEPDAWDSSVRGPTASKWQEMPLVGTLLGVAQAVLVLGAEEASDRLEEHAQELKLAAGANGFDRPLNIQTASQWSYISRLALTVTQILGVDSKAAHDEALKKFGTSGIATLLEVVKLPSHG